MELDVSNNIKCWSMHSEKNSRNNSRCIHLVALSGCYYFQLTNRYVLSSLSPSVVTGMLYFNTSIDWVDCACIKSLTSFTEVIELCWFTYHNLYLSLISFDKIYYIHKQCSIDGRYSSKSVPTCVYVASCVLW